MTGARGPSPPCSTRCCSRWPWRSFSRGRTMEQLAYLLSSNGVSAVPVFAGASSVDEFRREAAANLARPDDYVLVDFWRGELGQDFGAHWSPLAAYHEGTDRFLVLDV